MKLKIDAPAARRFVEVSQTDVNSERRRYYTTRADDPVSAILVCRGQTNLYGLAGQVADAQVGYEAGVAGFVLDERIGERHVKITIYRRLRLRQHDWTLGQLLAGENR